MSSTESTELALYPPLIELADNERDKQIKPPN